MGPGGPGISLTRLDDGRYLIAGGAEFPNQATLDEADLFDPSTGEFTALPSMVDARVSHTATLLGDGRVLLVGGSFLFQPGIGHARTSAEIFSLDDGPDVSLSVPADKAEEVGMRPPIGGEEVQDLFELLGRKDIREPANWSRRWIENAVS